jgi:hypothetical protein
VIALLPVYLLRISRAVTSLFLLAAERVARA